MQTEAPKIDLPEARDLLGPEWRADWDYVWILPTKLNAHSRFGFTVVAGPVDFYYGSQMLLVGRLRRES